MDSNDINVAKINANESNKETLDNRFTPFATRTLSGGLFGAACGTVLAQIRRHPKAQYSVAMGMNGFICCGIFFGTQELITALRGKYDITTDTLVWLPLSFRV